MIAGKLPLTGARHERRDGLPVLVLTIAGRPAELDWEQKAQLVRAGLIFLGSEWEDDVPPIRFEVPGEPGNVVELRGFTRDRRVGQLWDRFMATKSTPGFRAGPVPIPAD